jgi:hypothetical protein
METNDFESLKLITFLFVSLVCSIALLATIFSDGDK